VNYYICSTQALQPTAGHKNPSRSGALDKRGLWNDISHR
jgi:hypothetical protein